MTDMLSTLASGFGDKALMLVDKDGTPAGHILGTEMVGAMEYEKYKRKFEHLPMGFVELEYLESTGTQYINTGYEMTEGSSYKMEVDLLPSDYNTNYFFSLGADYIGYFAGVYSGEIGLNTGVTFPSSGRTTLTLSVASNGMDCSLTDGTNTVTYTRSSGNYSYSPILFGRYTSAANLGRCKIFSAKIYKGATMLFDLVPAMRSSDGEVGMFDLITGAFLTNAGAGYFSYKIKDFPQGYTQLAYIGTDGSSWINTGVSGGSDTLSITCDFKWSTMANYAYIYGNYVNENTNTTRLLLSNTDNRMYATNNAKANGGSVGFNCARGIRHRIVSSFDRVIIDGTSMATSGTKGTNNSGIIAFFKSNVNTGVINIGAIIYSFNIKSNGADVLNLVPAMRDSDSEVGMYDLVSNTFLTNAGTGTFSYGEL